MCVHVTRSDFRVIFLNFIWLMCSAPSDWQTKTCLEINFLFVYILRRTCSRNKKIKKAQLSGDWLRVKSKSLKSSFFLEAHQRQLWSFFENWHNLQTVRLNPSAFFLLSRLEHDKHLFWKLTSGDWGFDWWRETITSRLRGNLRLRQFTFGM